MNPFWCKSAQLIHGGRRHETVSFEDQEVKGQGHTRPKIDLEAWRRHHSRETFLVCYHGVLVKPPRQRRAARQIYTVQCGATTIMLVVCFSQTVTTQKIKVIPEVGLQQHSSKFTSSWPGAARCLTTRSDACQLRLNLMTEQVRYTWSSDLDLLLSHCTAKVKYDPIWIYDAAVGQQVGLHTSVHLVLVCQFFSRGSSPTRDIDIAILSVCPSVRPLRSGIL